MNRLFWITALVGSVLLPAAPAAAQTPLPTPAPIAVPPPAPVIAAPVTPPISVPPPAAVPAYVPFKSLPPMALDEANNGVGIAQQLARAKGLQARVIWIDGTANIGRVNTPEKITLLMAQLKTAGFNTVVFDVKPIVGETLYPSRYAPKLVTWRGQTLPPEFDPLAEMVKDAHADGLTLVASMNVFSEGHRDFHLGPGYDHPEWQTVLYEPSLQLMSNAGRAFPYALSDRANQPPRTPDQLALYTDPAALTRPLPGTLVALLDANMRVVAQIDGAALPAVSATVPPGGCALLGSGPAGDYLRQYAGIGSLLSLLNSPSYIPISARPEQQVPLMTNPNNPVVQARILTMIGEVVRNYAVDGVIFDDRMRYAAINADFSPQTRAQFEAYVGHPLRWPDDVFTYQVSYPTLGRRVVPGSNYNDWLTFRALTIRNWLASAVTTVKTIRPAATVSVYAGSWYPDYPLLGSNWAAPDFSAGLRFLTPPYQQTGFAGLVDWITTGCYYTSGTIADAVASGNSAGNSIEAAGQFSNRAVNDQTWVYAGIALSNYDKHPELLQRALQAAAASTQGVMVFDLSHNIDQFWPTFQATFAGPATPPHAVPGLLDDLRRQRAARKASGIPDPPVILSGGTPGTGL